MLDPGLEYLHRYGRVWRATRRHPHMLRELALDLSYWVPVVLLFMFAPAGSWDPVPIVVLEVVGLVAASLVRFDIGSGSTSPLVLFQVPLWFSVPPAWLAVLVAVALGAGRAIERWRGAEEVAPLRLIVGTSDAWPAIGPALVLALAGSQVLPSHSVLVFAAAFAAHTAIDFTLGVVAPWLIYGLKPAIQSRVMIWVVAIDVALAPVGFMAAVVMEEEPWAIVGLIPMVIVLGEFARERADRLDQAVDLSSAYRGTAELMGDVLEAEDDYTGGEHTRGVVELAVEVGVELRLGPKTMRNLEFGALLHDIGKLRVPNEIINKPGALSDEEWAIIRQHPGFGQEMLDRVGGALSEAGQIVRAHHERWDGDGYPDGLLKDAIPIEARIITACDSFSAITTTRAYRTGRTAEDAIAELCRCAGTQFDPEVVEALVQVVSRRTSEAQYGQGDGNRLHGVARALGLQDSP